MLLRARAITSGLSCNLPYGVVLATNGILRAAISTYLEGASQDQTASQGTEYTNLYAVFYTGSAQMTRALQQIGCARLLIANGQHQHLAEAYASRLHVVFIS